MKPFVAWDGEAVRDRDDPSNPDHPYCLFGNSLGWRVQAYNLNTEDCLSLIIESEQLEPDAIHFGFAFNYDVNMILRNLPLHTLWTLKRFGKCRYKGFDIEYLPRKWFRVAYGRGKGRSSAQIFDTFTFFNSSLGNTLRKYRIGSQEQLDRIDAGKGERPDFQYEDITLHIEPYWETELVLMVELMDTFRGILENAGIFLRSWHGPGAIANYLLKTNGAKSHYGDTPDEVIEAGRYAYFGGRFEPFMAGYYDGPVYSADINSAYPFSHSRLPSLSEGKWVHGFGRGSNAARDIRLGLYHVSYGCPADNQAMPLPHRDRSGSVSFPNATSGWIHAPEAALVWNDPNAEIDEHWIFEDDGTFPFAWIEEMYEERLRMKERGDPTEYGLKLGINSLYGRVAQRAGWEKNGQAPPWHNLEWAGAITSECRSMVYSAAKSVGKGLISVDTDGVLSAIPFQRLPNGDGERLGQWKLSKYTGLLYVQNGFYWLRDADGKWLPPKSRGIPRKKLEFDTIWPILSRNQPIIVNQHQFIGFGKALRGRIDDWRKWLDEPRTISFGGDGKRIHAVRSCSTCRKGFGYTEGLHALMSVPPKSVDSFPHNLPWLTDHDGFSTLESRYETMELEKWGIYLDG